MANGSAGLCTSPPRNSTVRVAEGSERGGAVLSLMRNSLAPRDAGTARGSTSRAPWCAEGAKPPAPEGTPSATRALEDAFPRLSHA
ncbi:hypothetical protein GCM10010295_50220 [Streptomyces intermedius]